MGYAVCTSCSFLRAFAERHTPQRPQRCPACGSEVELHDSEQRFHPTYVYRASVEIHAAPPLRH